MVYSAPMRSTAMGSSVMAQAPVAAMGSTSISMSRGIASTSEMAASPQVRGMYTAASNIVGGVTTFDSGQRNVPGRRRAPGDPEGGEHNWVDNGDGTYTCTICGETISEEDYLDGNLPPECVPLDLNWAVMLFFALLTAAYGAYKKRTSTVQ